MTVDRSVRKPTANREITLPNDGIAADFAAQVLAELEVPILRPHASQADWERHPHLTWARSGAMALSGLPDGPPLLAPAPLASAAQGALLALRALAGGAWRGGELDAATLLGERAAIFGFERRGSTAPGGSCRMIRTADGWLAVNLARPSDREMVPAWLEVEPSIDPWSLVEARLPSRSASQLLSRARLMGLPVAPVAPFELESSEASSWLRMTPGVGHAREKPDRAPLVLDLSSLWAGPLCGHLLALAGAEVIKLESLERPDGARSGPSHFFDLLNGGKAGVALEFTSERGRSTLEQLLERVDIVIESARPRALAQFGIVAEEWVCRRPGLTWLSITGYGRPEPEAGWVAFGDDAAAAAGLSWATAQFNPSRAGPAPPIFCGDAIADPLTGLHAAPAALASWLSGESRLLDVSLRGVVHHILHRTRSSSWHRGSAKVERDETNEWHVRVEDETQSVAPPRARPRSAPGPTLGVDTDRVLDRFGIKA